MWSIPSLPRLKVCEAKKRFNLLIIQCSRNHAPENVSQQPQERPREVAEIFTDGAKELPGDCELDRPTTERIGSAELSPISSGFSEPLTGSVDPVVSPVQTTSFQANTGIRRRSGSPKSHISSVFRRLSSDRSSMNRPHKQLE